jgi:hypothetical protein
MGMNNGPEDQCFMACSTRTWQLKCVFGPTIADLELDLANVANAFDSWTRDRGSYCALEWNARRDGKTDEAYGQ